VAAENTPAVTIMQDGRVLGDGFLISRGYAVAPGLSAERADVVVADAAGHSVGGRIVAAPLIELDGPELGAGPEVTGEPWFAELGARAAAALGVQPPGPSLPEAEGFLLRFVKDRATEEGVPG
jgi:hypothetical protein